MEWLGASYNTVLIDPWVVGGGGGSGGGRGVWRWEGGGEAGGEGGGERRELLTYDVCLLGLYSDSDE